jgi:hypothetical protein
VRRGRARRPAGNPRPGESDGELDAELESAVPGWDEDDLRVDGDVAHLLDGELDALRRQHHGPLEARGIADREELLGIGATTLATTAFPASPR